MRANYKVEFASGIFLALGVAALVWLATEATNYGQELGDDTYVISARFINVGDLKDRAPVKVGGVSIGLVKDVRLDPVTFEALVEMHIDRRINELPADTSAAILTSGVLGDRYVSLEPGGDPAFLEDGDELFITQSAVVLEQLIGKYLLNPQSSDEE